MSLINQMLRDLESRRPPGLPPGTVLSSGHGDSRTRRRAWLAPALALLVAVLATALGLALWRQAPTPASASPSVTSTPPATVPANAATPPASAVVNVTPAATAAPVAAASASVARAAPERPLAIPAPNSPPEPGQLHSVTPSVVDGSWQARPFTLRGTALGDHQRLLVNWGEKEKVLPPTQVEWLDETTARVRLVTGNTDAIWRITLINPDGSRDGGVEFEVIASPYLGSRGTSENTTTAARVEKTIHPPTVQERADQLYQQGYRALQQRNPEGAERDWLQALATDPRHGEAREGLAALYLSQGRKVEAGQLLEAGLRQTPDNPRYAQLYARLLAEQGEMAAALAALEPALGAATQHPELYALAAALYQQQRQYGKSINHYQRALQLQPQQATWWMGLGISLEGEGKRPEAKSAYEEAVRRGGLDGESLGYVQGRLQALD